MGLAPRGRSSLPGAKGRVLVPVPFFNVLLVRSVPEEAIPTTIPHHPHHLLFHKPLRHSTTLQKSSHRQPSGWRWLLFLHAPVTPDPRSPYLGGRPGGWSGLGMRRLYLAATSTAGLEATARLAADGGAAVA